MAVNPNLTIRYADVDLSYETVLSSTPPGDDGPVWMVNLMRYRPLAEYADGRATSLTGAEADDTYVPFEAFAEVGADLVFLAEVEAQLLGAEPAWDRVAVVRYPTRRSFVDMTNSPAFEAKHPHKDAGMEQTIVVGGIPIEVPEISSSGAAVPDWSEVPHPPTEDDPPIVILHLLRFHDGAATSMGDYQRAAGAVAVPHGVRIAAWFGVEGTILGDGRRWDQVRFNAFPSRAAFFAVAADPERRSAQEAQRETAIADTYTLLLRPVLDRLRSSLGA